MIKQYNEFLNEASVPTQIQKLKAEVSELRDQIANAQKTARETGGNEAAKKAAEIAALNVEATVLATIMNKIREIARLMASPESTNP
jgi:predicted  nucleic acid-binding Zn-ribbon protein